MNTDLTSKNRIYAFDIMRIIAIVAVVFIHTAADFVIPAQNHTAAFFWGNVFDSLTRFAVPIFIMISGALMLNENKETSPKKCLQSALNIFVLTVVWSLLYAVGYNLIKPLVFREPISVSAFFDTLLNGHYHMWYLYTLIGLYLVTPILRCFVKKENARSVRNYLLFSVVICFVFPFADHLLNIFTSKAGVLTDYASNFRLDYLYEHLTYYVLGWYLTNTEIKKKARVFLYIGGAFGLVLTFVCTRLFFTDPDILNNFFYSNDSLNVFLYSVAVFVFVLYRFNKERFATRLVLLLSKLTFGVYLVHCIFLFGFKMVCSKFSFAPLQILITALGTVTVSFVAVYILSKIPYLKKLIRG